jgi:hypothetical protein
LYLYRQAGFQRKRKEKEENRKKERKREGPEREGEEEIRECSYQSYYQGLIDWAPLKRGAWRACNCHSYYPVAV